MKDNKGFTLIELLAVITLIGILMLLIMPRVLELYSKAEKQSFIVEVEMVKKEAEKKYMADGLNKVVYQKYCDESHSDDSCTKLDIQKTEEQYIVEVDSKGHVTSIAFSNKKYCYANNNVTPSDPSITFSEIENGMIVCSNGVCDCFDESNKAKVTISVVNGKADSYEAIVDKGQTALFYITPNPTYSLEDAQITGNCIFEDGYLLYKNAQGTNSCHITLNKQKYLVNVVCTGCTSSPANAYVEHGANKSFTITANTNYTLNGIAISGEDCSIIGNTLTVSDVTHSKTCTLIAKSSWKCENGTLTSDATRGKNSGGYICVTNATHGYYDDTCEESATPVYDCTANEQSYIDPTTGITYHYNCSNSGNKCECTYWDICTNCYVDNNYNCASGWSNWNSGCARQVTTTGNATVSGYTCNNGSLSGSTCYYDCQTYGYYCPSGWTRYSGSNSSLKCYKAATK